MTDTPWRHETNALELEKGTCKRVDEEFARMSSTGPFKVGDWLVEPELDRISRGSESKNLRPKVMELLVYLAVQRGRVVSADELLDDLWAGKIVTGGSVYRCVGELRDALAGSEDRQVYVDTIPKKGYRLLAPVVGLGNDLEPVGETRKPKWMLAIAAAVLLAAFAFWTSIRTTTEPPVAEFNRKSIAVLPFENLSANPDDAYIASGMHNELLTQLTKIDGLRVISRVSVMEYRERPKNMREIGRELGVATILEGSVQRVGDVVRVNVQLIDARTDDHLWADAYDSKFTVKNILSIQRNMTTSIARALHTTLSPEAAARISEVPTKNTRAYDFYLSGNEFFARTDRRKSIPLAVIQYQRAVEEDPEFAVAWAALANAHTEMYADRFLDRTAPRLKMARDALERAIELAPDLPEAYIASGVYHYIVGNYEKALADYDVAGRGLPGNARIYGSRAAVLERAGRWDESVVAWARAIELDPRNVGILQGQALNQIFLRDYAQAEHIYNRILELRPDLSEAFLFRDAIIPFLRDGDFAAVQAALRHPQTTSLDHNLRNTFGWFAAVYARDYATALEYVDNWEVDEYGRLFRYLFKESFFGATYRLAGQQVLAEQNFRAAIILIDAALAEIESNPPKAIPEEHAILLTARAEALAGLGQAEEASRLAHQAIEMMPYTKDAMWASIIQHGAIRKVLVTAGDHDAAIAQLDAYLAAPGRLSIEGIIPDPHMDSIRDDPRFVALVEKFKR